MMLFIMQTLPWQGGVISPRPVQAPPLYFLVPCTLNRSALLNVLQWLCARGCVSFGPKIHFFFFSPPTPASKHYPPRPRQRPPPSVSAICRKLAAINWKTMAGPSGRVKAICIEASPGRPLISSLSEKRLPVTLASEMSGRIESARFDVPCSFGRRGLSGRRARGGTLSVSVHVGVTKC